MNKNLKIILEDGRQFECARDALIKIGYQYPGENYADVAQYLYAYDNGTVEPDFSDDGEDAAALNYAGNKHQEISLGQLKIMAYGEHNAVFFDVDPDYQYYSVDGDDQAYYTHIEPKLNDRKSFWDKDISMRDAPNFELHNDWKQSLIKRDSSPVTTAELEDVN